MFIVPGLLRERLAQETGRDADELCAVLNGVLQ